MIRVLLVDDRSDFRQTFARLLERQPDLEVVAAAGSLAEGRTMLSKAWTLRFSTAGCLMGTGWSSSAS
jgi:chemotaxis response regulator CheB